MKFEVNIEKRHLLGLLVFGVILIGITGVIAYNIEGSGGEPAAFGHSVDEIDWTQLISGNVTAQGFCINDACVTSWDDLHDIRLWTVSNPGTANEKIRYENMVEIGSNLRVEGARIYLDGEDSGGNFWLMAGGNTEGTNNALGFNPTTKKVRFGPGWTPSLSGSIAVVNSGWINGWAVAQCPDGYMVIGGGGGCYWGDQIIRHICPWHNGGCALSQNPSQVTQWAAVCSAGQAAAWAICITQ